MRNSLTLALFLVSACGGIISPPNGITSDGGGGDDGDDPSACEPSGGTILEGHFTFGCAGVETPNVRFEANGYDTTQADAGTAMWSCAAVTFDGCEAHYTNCTTSAGALPAAMGNCSVVSTDVTFAVGGDNAQGSTTLSCGDPCYQESVIPTDFYPLP